MHTCTTTEILAILSALNIGDMEAQRTEVTGTRTIAESRIYLKRPTPLPTSSLLYFPNNVFKAETYDLVAAGSKPEAHSHLAKKSLEIVRDLLKRLYFTLVSLRYNFFF